MSKYCKLEKSAYTRSFSHYGYSMILDIPNSRTWDKNLSFLKTFFVLKIHLKSFKLRIILIWAYALLTKNWKNEQIFLIISKCKVLCQNCNFVSELRCWCKPVLLARVLVQQIISIPSLDGLARMLKQWSSNDTRWTQIKHGKVCSLQSLCHCAMCMPLGLTRFGLLTGAGEYFWFRCV